MSKKGWWRQLQCGDYPKSQTNYGQDLKALEGERGTNTDTNQKKERQQIQKKCSVCGNPYWVDKGCHVCNPDSANKNKLSPKTSIPKHLQTKIRVYCPICNNPMVLRTAKQGKFKGQRFWGCSKYPNCRGTSNYSGG